MPSYLSEANRIEILMMIGFGDRSRTQAEVARLFHENHPDLPAINRSTVSKIENQYRELGHVRPRPRQRQPAIDDDERINVLLSVQENAVVSARQLAREHHISHSSVLRMLKNAKLHPYKMQMVQELIDDDPHRRVEFCDRFMTALDNHQIALQWVLFSDEATFSLHGHVNRQNCRYWADENPHWMRETHTQRPRKTNVWAGIIGDRILGPFFFDGNLTGPIYLDFLRDDVIPALRELFPNELDPDAIDARLWFQQDGAPPHYARIVRQYLDEVFPNHWIGRRGPIEWPPRSPDLTPLDFFLWGYLKSKVYHTKPNDIAELQERIRNEIRQITPQVLQNVRNGVYHRLGYCQQQNGAHFEHLLH